MPQLTILLDIWEVLDFNQLTDVSRFSSVLPGKCLDNMFNINHLHLIKFNKGSHHTSATGDSLYVGVVFLWTAMYIKNA